MVSGAVQPDLCGHGLAAAVTKRIADRAARTARARDKSPGQAPRVRGELFQAGAGGEAVLAEDVVEPAGPARPPFTPPWPRQRPQSRCTSVEARQSWPTVPDPCRCLTGRTCCRQRRRCRQRQMRQRPKVMCRFSARRSNGSVAASRSSARACSGSGRNHGLRKSVEPTDGSCHVESRSSAGSPVPTPFTVGGMSGHLAISRAAEAAAPDA